jgi:hypothetical protein
VKWIRSFDPVGVPAGLSQPLAVTPASEMENEYWVLDGPVRVPTDAMPGFPRLSAQTWPRA